MLKTIWISFDLGVKGDYSGLYRWLDNSDAVECGDSLACVRLEIPEGTDPAEFVAEEIEEIVDLSKSDRIYAIWRNDDGKIKGRFLFGKRKASPWQGYGDNADVEDDI